MDGYSGQGSHKLNVHGKESQEKGGTRRKTSRGRLKVKLLSLTQACVRFTSSWDQRGTLVG